MGKPVIIAVDFDGTIVKHEYPKIGEPVPGAIDWIKRWQTERALIILWTMRSGKYLDEAVEYLSVNGISLFGVNINPTQEAWTNSPKAYAQLYIDDAAFGCPLCEEDGMRPFVNWDIVGKQVYDMIKESRG